MTGYQSPSGPGGSQTSGYQPPAGQRRRSGHGLRNTIIIVIALLVVLVGVDRLAAFYVQGRIASEIQDQGFPSKPDVSIKGFPFLTQVISRHFQGINADLSDVRLNSGFSGGTVGHLSGAGVITFASMSNALGSLVGGPLSSLVGSAGLTLKPVSSDEVKASINLVVTSGSAIWRVTRVSGTKIRVHLVSSQGLPSQLLGSVRNIKVPVPQLPLGMKIQSLTVTSAGISIRVTGSHVAFGG